MTTTLALLLAATIPLRNPFWPIGHNGKFEAITDEPVVNLAPVAEKTAEDTKTSVNPEAIAAAQAAALAAERAKETEGARTERRWIAARKSLRFGNMLRTSGENARQAITINGHIYSDGDLVSTNHNGYRFTWRVKQLTGARTLQLQRVRFRELDAEIDEQ